MSKIQKSKAAIYLGIGLFIAATYVNAAHPVQTTSHGIPLEISSNLSSADDWDSPFVAVPVK
ncbi:MAG: hypothetical protein ABJF23_28550 [Bryobacteraceae bacterium]